MNMNWGMCVWGGWRLGEGRGWRVDEGDAAVHTREKTNDAQTDGTRHNCHIQLLSSYKNLTGDQPMQLNSTHAVSDTASRLLGDLCHSSTATSITIQVMNIIIIKKVKMEKLIKPVRF